MRIAYIYLNTLDRKTANVNQVLNMLHGLGKLAETVFISSFMTTKKYSKTLEFYALSHPSFRLARMPVSLVDKNFFLEKVTRLLYSCSTLAYLRLHKFDAIYTRDFAFLLFLSYVPRFLKPRQKVFFEVHTIYHISSPRKVSYAQESRALRETHSFFPISSGVKEDLVKKFGISESRACVLPDGVNLENFEKIKKDGAVLRERYGIGEGEFVVVYSGSFKRWKGVDTLVRAAQYMRQEAVKILLIGGDGEDKERIDALVRDLSVQDKVIVDKFLPQETVIQVLKNADAAVIPNTRTPIGGKYTSPLKLFEYMACGLPIIASDLPAIREVAREWKNYSYFSPENEQELATAIKKLLADRQPTTERPKPDTEAIHEFTWDRRAEKVYKRLVAAVTKTD